MYAPQLFALGQWGTGRIENIMYDMFLILTVVLEFYWIGWIQKKQKLYWNADSLKWYGFCTGMTVICFLLVSLASPKEITSAAIVNAVRSGEAQAYADAIEQNIVTIKNSDEALILIQERRKLRSCLRQMKSKPGDLERRSITEKIKFVIMKSWISDRRWGIKTQIKLKRQKRRRLLR